MAILKVLHVGADGVGPDRERRLITTLAGDAEGIVGTGDLLVSEKAATPNMSIDVAIGRAFVIGTEATIQGAYMCETDAVTNLVVGDGDASNPRIDIVVAQVRDSDYSGVSDDWLLAVVAGVPAGTPSAPAVPNNSIKLAEIAVAALESTSILNAVITDFRASWAPSSKLVFQAAGTSQVVASAAFPLVIWNESLDVNGGHTPDATGTDYVIPSGQDGLYLVTASVKVTAAATEAFLQILTSSDGSPYSGTAPNNNLGVSMSATFTLAAGDTINVGFTHTSGANRTIATISSLKIVKLA